MVWLLIGALFALSAVLLWVAVGHNPSEYRRQRERLERDVNELGREVGAALLPPVERLMAKMTSWLKDSRP